MANETTGLMIGGPAHGKVWTVEAGQTWVGVETEDYKRIEYREKKFVVHGGLPGIEPGIYALWVYDTIDDQAVLKAILASGFKPYQPATDLPA